MVRGFGGVSFGFALLALFALTHLPRAGTARAAERVGEARTAALVRPGGGIGDAAPAIAKLHVATSTQILGYRIDINDHAERVCKMPLPIGASYADIATDKFGDILAPMDEAYPGGVTVYAGPGMCGKPVGIATEEWAGYPIDAASLDALTGKIVFASVPPFSLSGGVFVCRLSGPCSELYTGQPYYAGDAISVAIDSAGDCWAVLPYYPTSDSYALEFFQGCRHSGVVAADWVNPAGGGLDVDEHGNLLSISSNYYGGSGSSVLYVYRGCKPKCTKIGGPFPIGHDALYGHVSRDNTLFATTGEGFVDVYAYSPTSLKPKLSFNVGTDQSYGVAFSPGR